MKTKTLLILAGGLAVTAYANDDKLDKFDADNDGRVTRAEFSGGSLSKFVKMDTDGDGDVTAQELSAVKEKRSSGLKFWEKDDKSADKAMEADQNGDGKISRAEHEAHISSKFDLMDANKDGVLSESELEVKHDGHR